MYFILDGRPDKLYNPISLLEMSNFSFRISGHSEEEIMISLKLVKDSFGITDIASKSYYQWQYMQNPVGQGTVLLAYQDGEPAGQFACIPCRYKYTTEDLVVPLTLNLCVLSKFRGRGLMSQLITTMHSYLENEHKFSIGVPNQESIKGHLYLNYTLFLFVQSAVDNGRNYLRKDLWESHDFQLCYKHK